MFGSLYCKHNEQAYIPMRDNTVVLYCNVLVNLADGNAVECKQKKQLQSQPGGVRG